MNIKIRPMTEADTEIVGEVFREGWKSIAVTDGLTDDQLAHLLRECCLPAHLALIRGRYDCFVAELHERIVGAIAVGAGVIEELWVRPNHHRQGVGAALFKHAEYLVRQAGRSTLSVSTTGYGRPFYEAMGMRVVGHRTVAFGPLVGRNLVVLEKPLKS